MGGHSAAAKNGMGNTNACSTTVWLIANANQRTTRAFLLVSLLRARRRNTTTTTTLATQPNSASPMISAARSGLRLIHSADSSPTHNDPTGNSRAQREGARDAAGSGNGDDDDDASVATMAACPGVFVASMSLTRRSLIALLATSSAAASAASSPAALRLLFVRHSTLLVEAGGLRLLLDPSLRETFGAQGALRPIAGSPPPPPPAALGRVDVVLVTCGEPGSFDPDSVARLDVRRARFIVPDDGVRKQLALLGHHRVRGVRPGDVVDLGPLRVTVSPGRGVVSAAVGFHIDDGAQRLWHTGTFPPLDVDAQVMSFAADHAADVVCACASGLRSSSEPAIFADVDDALALARIARARVLLPIGGGVVPAGLLSLVLSVPTKTTTTTTTRDPHVEDPVPLTWYRFRL